MTTIEQSNVSDNEWLRNHELHRFVRIGDNFYYSDDIQKFHSTIARENGVTKTDVNGRPIVDDAGTIEIFKGKLDFTKFSTSCACSEREDLARKKTKEIARNKFGNDNIA